MKKKVLSVLIPFLALALSSCVMYNGQGKPGASSKEKVVPSSSTQPVNYSIEPSTPPAPHGAGEEEGEEVPPDTMVKVYLVFGENGLFDGNPVNDPVADKFLEHTLERTLAVGSDLPGKDHVTSSVEGSTFVAWTAYNNDGKITEYTKVPNVDGKILYASFTGGTGGAHSGSSGGSQGGGSQGGGSQGGGETPQTSEYPGSTKGDLPTTGFGLVFSDGTYMDAQETDPFEGFLQYYITKRSFKQGQAFSLYDFANNAGFLAKVINNYSFGGNDDQPVYSQYLSTDTTNKRYVVLKDFNAESIYLKFKMDNDQIYIELAH